MMLQSFKLQHHLGRKVCGGRQEGTDKAATMSKEEDRWTAHGGGHLRKNWTQGAIQGMF